MVLLKITIYLTESPSGSVYEGSSHVTAALVVNGSAKILSDGWGDPHVIDGGLFT